MSCRIFKYQIMDYQSGRLSSEQSQRVADHLKTCAVCAQETAVEARLQKIWQGAAPAPARDFWPQIATRLEGLSDRTKRPQISIRPPQWALVSAFGLAIVAVCGLSIGPKEFGQLSTPPGITAPVTPAVAVTDSSKPVWSEFSDVSRVNPTVDDPAGSSMENVWVQINPGDSAKAEGQ